MAGDKKELIADDGCQSSHSSASDDTSSLDSLPATRHGWKSVAEDMRDGKLMKAHTAFWLFGFLNHFGCMIILSGAHDISQGHDQAANRSPKGGDSHYGANTTLNVTGNVTTCDNLVCNHHSTGIILLANTVPTIFIKLFAPHFLKSLSYCVRIVAMAVLTTASLLLIALVKTQSVSLIGVILMSCSFGLGELSFLGMTSYYPASAVSYWASGTGASGLVASWTYVLMRRHLSPRDSHLICLFVPILMLLVYWKLVELPKPGSKSTVKLGTQRRYSDVGSPKTTSMVVFEDEHGLAGKSKMDLTSGEKIQQLRSLMVYMLPLLVVYYSEYLINQGLYELMIWRTCLSIDPSAQYRWFLALYHTGVFISRSSAQVCPIRPVWILALLQAANLGLLLAEVAYHILPSIFLVFAIILYEGCLGGACYVNTFANIHRNVEPRMKEFSLSAASVADGIGITLAGLSALPLHNHYCQLLAK